MKTLVASPFEDDAAELLQWAYGEEAKQAFLDMQRTNEYRTGQSFMNTLFMFDNKEYARLAASDVDPFYDDSLMHDALDLFTSK
jgi:hypothetical protein